MLVLTRNQDQSVFIGRDGEIVVKVLEIKRGGVKLGIAAPESVNIYREEIFERVLAEREAGKLVTVEVA